MKIHCALLGNIHMLHLQHHLHYLKKKWLEISGEIVGGSQREERLEVLEKCIKDLNIDVEELWWYLDLRRFGSVPHSGFGLGFERLVQFVTGMNNIRDVIPFPLHKKIGRHGNY